MKKDLFESYGRFPKIDIIKMEEKASKILGWRCKIVLAKEPYFCKYCGRPIEKFKVQKYRMCQECYDHQYYEKNEEYFKEKNKERYEKDPETQRERNRENNKKYEGHFLYKLFLKGKLVYIGSTTNLYKRSRQHIYEEKKKFDTLVYIDFSNSNINTGELRWLEHKLIREFNKPFYNTYENVKVEIGEERQKELLEMEMKEEYKLYDLTKMKKWKNA